ncbi:hypothetical protein [Formosa sp. PL04]|uniref:hypothetical protein n=1 Tax=Formosa sp. PL04 TaxID=3081755 RepID=UPI002981FC8E|nr:hypothetical protein [Formosa sp. PL04]MDW5290289.1 hypothetical protein [Formosa sp. PL04]
MVVPLSGWHSIPKAYVNALKKEFATVVSHDLKMPLDNLIQTSDIKKKYMCYMAHVF